MFNFAGLSLMKDSFKSISAINPAIKENLEDSLMKMHVVNIPYKEGGTHIHQL